MPSTKKPTTRNPLKRLSSNHTRGPPEKRVKASPPPPNPFEATIKKANALSVPQLQDRYMPAQHGTFTAKNKKQFNLTTHTSSSISSDELEHCFNLVEETSKADYVASTDGWSPAHKKEEMREADMRYVLVRPSDPDVPPSITKEEGDSESPIPISAFISFMLTLEEEQPVIYVYEIHTTPSARGIGLGRYMMTLVETIGRKVGMWKSMLTVFTRNTGAEEMYARLGYTVDEIGPQVRKLRGGKVKRPEYFIMSKELQTDERF